ncbi:Alpha/Beta hydrolase protein [Chytriomyces sp. MP71]|nr:Alpha/Beta hydrolase protein [Chytriomyces sp. MP71]
MDDVVVFLFIHGGAYCFSTSEYGSPHNFELIKSFNERQRQAGHSKRMVAFSVEYPLAPKAQFPAQVYSAADAYRWLVMKLGVKNIIVGGDSAGAHCTIKLMNHIAESDELRGLGVWPLANMLFSPWVDAADYWDPDQDAHDVISTLGIRFADRMVFGHTKHGRNDVLMIQPDDFSVASKGTLVMYGSSEILAHGIERYVGLLNQRTEPVPGLQVVCFEGMPHCFNLMLAEEFLPGARAKALEALNITVEFMTSVCA